MQEPKPVRLIRAPGAPGILCNLHPPSYRVEASGSAWSYVLAPVAQAGTMGVARFQGASSSGESVGKHEEMVVQVRDAPLFEVVVGRKEGTDRLIPPSQSVDRESA